MRPKVALATSTYELLLLALLVSGSYAVLGNLLPWLLLIMCLNTGFFWNVLLNVFAVRFGGATHASTLVFVLEISIYVAGVPLSFLNGHLAAAKDWVALFSSSVCFFYLGNVCAQLFVLFDEGASPMPKALQFWHAWPTRHPDDDDCGAEAKKDVI